MKPQITTKSAYTFIILMGIVSLFADITYEGARSIAGQFLAVLGASGAIVGFVAGFGELTGYGLRVFSGYLTDKTGQYWLITIVGYAINLFAVPLLALAGNWPLAAALLILERFGKALRTPARDAMLSFATKEVGRGWGFGLHEAMDQIGAITGPLIVTVVLYFQGSYQEGFLILLIPALCAISVLAAAKILFPSPKDLEREHEAPMAFHGFPKQYWLYIAAASLIGAGFVDFPLIAYHFEKLSQIPAVWIPIFFSIAMAADGIAALLLGRLYDAKGISVLIITTAICCLFALLVFTGGFYSALAGMVLWGIGLGSQESVMRAVVANLVPMAKRGTAYGIMNMWFGISWFAGSAIMGILYDISIPALIIFSLSCQLAAIPFLAATAKP